MLARDLRQSLLQSAFEGKLVNQNCDDESVAKVLNIQQIESTEDYPYNIPDNWKWVKFGDVSTYSKTKRKINAKDADKEIWMLDLEDVEKGGRLLCKKKVSEKKAIGDKTIFNKGNILYSKLRPYLLKVLIADDDGICTPELVPFDMLCGINSKYVEYYLKSPYVDYEINKDTYGVKMPRVGTDTMINLCFPFPPIEEQERIVAKVDELMAKIDEYEKIEKELSVLESNISTSMKESILQAVMQGKLTEQLDSDSDVEDYINIVLSKKKELLLQGKIRKDKTKTNEDEYPFEIPNNWRWVKLGNLADLHTGKTPPRAEEQWWGNEKDIPWFSIADMIPDSIVSKTKEYISQYGFENCFNNDISKKGTLIMSFKLTIGRVSILGIDAIHNEAIISIRLFEDNDNVLRNYLFKTLPYLTRYGDSKGAIKGNTLNQDSLCNLYIPIPPIEEQQRIVDKLDKLLPLCESLNLN